MPDDDRDVGGVSAMAGFFSAAGTRNGATDALGTEAEAEAKAEEAEVRTPEAEAPLVRTPCRMGAFVEEELFESTGGGCCAGGGCCCGGCTGLRGKEGSVGDETDVNGSSSANISMMCSSDTQSYSSLTEPPFGNVKPDASSSEGFTGC